MTDKKSRRTERASRAEVAAAIAAEQVRGERRRMVIFYSIVAVIVLAIVAAVAVYVNANKPAAAPTTTAKVSIVKNALVLGEATKSTPAAGAKKVPTVVIYEDFLCPYCREFETSSRAALYKAASQGKAVVEYRPFQVLGDEYSKNALTVWAATAKHATPRQALKLHDLLYENQPYEDDASKPDLNALIDFAGDAGVEDETALEAMKKANPEFIAAVNKVAQDAGVQGTPTIFVDGKKLEGASVAEMSANLKALLNK